MCRTIHALLTVVICGIQMLVRVFMTLILMIENVIRMFLQTLYNFISFILQLISLIPICCVFFATSRLKCFMCGGGGPCPVRRGGGCDCFMSAVAIIILFLIFRATGVLDKIFYSIGYAKAPKQVNATYSPATISDKECTREMINVTDGNNSLRMGADDDWVEMNDLGDKLNDELILEGDNATTIVGGGGDYENLTESEEMVTEEKMEYEDSNSTINDDANYSIESTNVEPSDTMTQNTNILSNSTISKSIVKSVSENNIIPDYESRPRKMIERSKTEGLTSTKSEKVTTVDDAKRYSENVSKLRQWLESSPIAYYMV